MNPSVSTTVALIQAARPKTLTAAVVPVMVATGLAFHDLHHVHWSIVALILFSAGFIQIGTNFFNDAIDFVKGADTTERLGPARATQMGWLSPRTVMVLAGVCFFLAFIGGIPLVMQGGWPIAIIGLVSLLMGYCYTGGPYPLAYKGLGDLFVLIFFGWVAVGGSYFLLTGNWNLAAFVAGTQVGLLGVVLIAVNNLRDRAHDAKVGKQTLSVRLGEKAHWEITVLILAAFSLNLYWWQAGQWKTAVFPFVVFPFALRLDQHLRRTIAGPIYNIYLAQAAKLQLGFGAVMSLALFLS